MIILGVDAGAHGAIAALDSLTGDLLMVEDMPADVVEVSGKERHRVSPGRLADIIRPFGSHPPGADGKRIALLMEQPTYRPLVVRNKQTGQRETRQPGAAGMAQLGESVGIIKGIAAAFSLAYTGVAPGAWKRVVRCPADKKEACRRAVECFPRWATFFKRVKDDGRAEAALIALYGAHMWRSDQPGNPVRHH